MPILQVRDVPDDLYERLARVAREENRSISQETIVLLRKALNLQQERLLRRERVLEEIENLTLEGPESLPGPAELIREDRER